MGLNAVDHLAAPNGGRGSRVMDTPEEQATEDRRSAATVIQSVSRGHTRRRSFILEVHSEFAEQGWYGSFQAYNEECAAAPRK